MTAPGKPVANREHAITSYFIGARVPLDVMSPSKFVPWLFSIEQRSGGRLLPVQLTPDARDEIVSRLTKALRATPFKGAVPWARGGKLKEIAGDHAGCVGDLVAVTATREGFESVRRELERLAPALTGVLEEATQRQPPAGQAPKSSRDYTTVWCSAEEAWTVERLVRTEPLEYLQSITNDISKARMAGRRRWGQGWCLVWTGVALERLLEQAKHVEEWDGRFPFALATIPEVVRRSLETQTWPESWRPHPRILRPLLTGPPEDQRLARRLARFVAIAPRETEAAAEKARVGTAVRG